MMSALLIAAGAAVIAVKAPFGWLALGFGALGPAVLGFILVRPNWRRAALLLGTGPARPRPAGCPGGRVDEAGPSPDGVLALGRAAGLGYVATVAGHVSALVDTRASS